MPEKIAVLNACLGIDLERFASQMSHPTRFLKCCEDFADKCGSERGPLSFCVYLRENRLLAEAKAICQFFLMHRPEALARFLE